MNAPQIDCFNNKMLNKINPISCNDITDQFELLEVLPSEIDTYIEKCIHIPSLFLIDLHIIIKKVFSLIYTYLICEILLILLIKYQKTY